MATKFKKKVKDIGETSDNMESINTYLTELDKVIQSIDWNAVFAVYPDPGGSLPPPNVPKWPP